MRQYLSPKIDSSRHFRTQKYDGEVEGADCDGCIAGRDGLGEDAKNITREPNGDLVDARSNCKDGNQDYYQLYQKGVVGLPITSAEKSVRLAFLRKPEYTIPMANVAASTGFTACCSSALARVPPR